MSLKCNACGKDLSAAVAILGESDVVEVHTRAHQREALPEIMELVKGAWLYARAELAELQKGSVSYSNLNNIVDLCKRAIDRGESLDKNVTFSKE